MLAPRHMHSSVKDLSLILLIGFETYQLVYEDLAAKSVIINTA